VEGNSVWELNDDFFFSSFDGYEEKITWSNFDSYEIIDTHLFTYRKHNGELLFSFSKREIGQEQFEKVVNFTKQKIES
jgi:hypothetical protein